MAAATSDDHPLLDRYLRDGDEKAFAEIVRRNVNLVYSAAARRVRDRHTAEDVTQAVFMILARRAASARRSGGPLSAWLLTAVRYAAANAVKMERRRRKHEEAAGWAITARDGPGGIASHDPSEALAWREVAQRLDDEVLKLPSLDRRAVLLRYFEQKPVRDVAAALNVTESAAKQRLSRSVDKLRRRLDRRGVTLAAVGAASLEPLLMAHAVHAAPAALAASAALGAAGAAAVTGSSTLIAKGAMTMMNVTKAKMVAAVVAAATVFGTGAVLTINREMARAQSPAGASAASVPQPSGDPVRDKALARVKAAEAILASVQERMRLGEPLTPTFIELQFATQRRVVDARIDAAIDHATRLGAAAEYLDQCKKLADITRTRREGGMDVSDIQVRLADYYVADAEFLLAKLKAAAAA